MNLIDLIHQKLELFRLEQRYTRRRNHRSTFVSEAQYVDGEYIYANSTSSYSKGGSDSDEGNVSRDGKDKDVKLGRRLSKMADWSGKADKGSERRAGDRMSRVSVREVRWDVRR